MSSNKLPRSIHFCFADPIGFSGQKIAAELVLNGLRKRDWQCIKLAQPVFARGSTDRWAFLRYLVALILAWVRALRLLAAKGSWLWVGLGQTRTAFVRDAVPILLARVGLGRERILVSLNGSLFMHWPARSLDARAFCFLLSQVGQVTVVGQRQRERLIAMGLPVEKVLVVANSCEFEAIDRASLAEKYEAASQEEVIHFLHLSSLVDTKGFPEYLEALQRLAELPGPRIDAILCGWVVLSEFNSRFRDIPSGEKWIEEKIAEINRGPRVRARWIKGAKGSEKEALFRAADVFALPTRYAVEAQPLVLLEAMASGCAIVTTQIGEIPTILDGTSAMLFAEISVEDLVSAFQELSINSGKRETLGRAAHARYLTSFQLERHLDRWEEILSLPSDSTARELQVEKSGIKAAKI